MTSSSSDIVARNATIRADTRGFTLLGVFGPETDMRALVRLSGGRVKQIETGARLPLGRVVAIDADGLMVERRGRTERVPVAGG